MNADLLYLRLTTRPITMLTPGFLNQYLFVNQRTLNESRVFWFVGMSRR